MADFWFGNLRKAGYFPAPNSGMDADTIGESDDMTFANGGAYVAQSPGTHREFDLSWGVQEKSTMNFLSDYRNGVYGTGLLYMVDPFATNAMPPHWANPGLTCEGWPSLVSPSVKPTRAAAGSVTNLAVNPSFETASSTLVPIRTNLFPDPRATSVRVQTRWYGSGGGNGTTTWGNSGGMFGSLFARKTWTVGSAGADVGYQSAQATASERIAVTGGTSITLSAYMRHSSATNYVARVGAQTYNAAGVAGALIWATPTFSIGNDWGRVSGTITLPADAATVYVIFSNQAAWAGAVPGVTLDISAILVEASPVLSDYFDGSFAPAGDFTYAWSGAANASTSMQQGLALPNGIVGNRTLAIQSSGWKRSGGYSIRLMPTESGANNDAYTTLAVPTLKPNTLYTIMAVSHLDAPLTGSLNTNGSRSLFVHLNGTTLVNRATPGAQAPNAAGDTQLRSTFTTPAVFTGFNTIRLYHGGFIGSGDVYFDDLLIAEGDYKGPYFDGTTEFLDGTKGAWVDPANTSSSASTLARTPGRMPNTGAQYTLTGEIGVVPRRRLVLLVPTNRDLWLGFSGLSTNGAVLRMRGITADGAYGPVSDLVLLDPSGTTRLNTKVSGGQYSAIQVYMTTTLAGSATITLVSGKAVYSEVGATPALTGDHVEGDGHTGFQIGDISTAYVQAADGHQYVTTATKGTEIEAWL